MILESLRVARTEFERRTGWELKPEGACKGEMCVPMPQGATRNGELDVSAVAERLGMPLVRDDKHGVWALGPESVGGKALSSALAPDLELPDWRGSQFRLSSLRGQKVLLIAWASW
jgi:hypothetical protein